jgi:hypothetical protein
MQIQSNAKLGSVLGVKREQPNNAIVQHGVWNGKADILSTKQHIALLC